MRDILPDIERWRAEGKRIALATVVSVTGSAPRGVGAVLAASESGEVSGSVSGGCVEPAVIEAGLRAIRSGHPTLLTFGISEEQNVERIGLSCGGEIRVFIERMGELAPLFEALRVERPSARAIVLAAPAESAVNGALPARPLAKSSAVSLVDISPSTQIILKESLTARRSTSC